MDQEFFKNLMGVLPGLTGLALNAVSRWRHDKLDIELERLRMMGVQNQQMYPYPMYPQPMFGYGYPPPPMQCQCYQKPPVEVNWVDIDTSAPYRNTLYRNSMYANSNEITFGNNDEIIREIGNRPPQQSPLFGYRYY